MPGRPLHPAYRRIARRLDSGTRRICVRSRKTAAVEGLAAASGALPARAAGDDRPGRTASNRLEADMIRLLSLCALCAASPAALAADPAPAAMVVPPDPSRWELEGEAKIVDHQGRPSILLDGGAATLKGFEMRDAVIDVDVSTPASRGFFGIQFRLAGDSRSAEWVYLRQHKSGLPDAMQYTPVLGTGLNWQLYNGPGFTGAIDIPKDAWFHLRLEVTGAQAKLFVKDMEKPALVMDDLKSGLQKGQVALAVLIGETYFSNFQIRPTPDAAWERHLPPMPVTALTRWSISPP